MHLDEHEQAISGNHHATTARIMALSDHQELARLQARYPILSAIGSVLAGIINVFRGIIRKVTR